MATTAALTLADRIDALKADRGDAVPVDDLADVVNALFDSEVFADLRRVSGELGDLVGEIGRAKAELVAMRPKTLSARDIPDATDELDAVVKATEEAAGRIMDAADTVGQLADHVDKKAAEQLRTVATDLFEASSFQDITGQRITKVVSTLSHLEHRLSALAAAIGDEAIDDDEPEVFDEAGEVIDDTALLHGPQAEGEGNSQEEIDAILASFD